MTSTAASALINTRVLAAMRVAIGLIAILRSVSFVVKALETPESLTTVHVAGIALWASLALLVTIGWRGRLAAGVMVLLWGGLVAFDSGFFYKNHNYLITLTLFAVAFSDCERHYALRPRGQGEADSLGLFLMKYQVSIVYLFAGLAKINGQYLSGDVLSTYMRDSLLPLSGLLASQTLVVALSVSVIALELSLAIAVWSERLRPAAFGAALLLHLGMVLGTGVHEMYGIFLFALAMFVLLTAFLRVPERGRLVVWDDSCAFCQRWVAAFRRLDAFGALRFVGAGAPAAYDGTGVTPAAAAHALQLVEPDGRVRSGFDAVQGIVAVLPGGYLLAPYMSLPGVRPLGRAVYRRIAEGRTCRYLPPADMSSLETTHSKAS